MISQISTDSIKKEIEDEMGDLTDFLSEEQLLEWNTWNLVENDLLYGSSTKWLDKNRDITEELTSLIVDNRLWERI